MAWRSAAIRVVQRTTNAWMDAVSAGWAAARLQPPCLQVARAPADGADRAQVCLVHIAHLLQLSLMAGTPLRSFVQPLSRLLVSCDSISRCCSCSRHERVVDAVQQLTAAEDARADELAPRTHARHLLLHLRLGIRRLHVGQLGGSHGRRRRRERLGGVVARGLEPYLPLSQQESDRFERVSSCM